MIKVLMLKSNLGSPCGKVVNEYHAGLEYDMPESLATVFIETGFAKEAAPTENTAGDNQEQETTTKKKGKK